MQTDANSFTVIAKPKNESDTWKIEERSLCCDAKSDSLSFDAVIQPALNHASFYREAIEDKVSKFISGCNVTLATYGAANTGKTHTIIGTAGQTRLKSEARGVIVRAVSQLFDYVHSKENFDKVFRITASFYHVFDDGRVADLLDTQKRNVDLIAGTDPTNGQPYYTAAVTKQAIHSVEEVISLVERGSLMRNASGCVRNKSQQQPSLLKQQPLLQAYKAHLSHAFFCLSLEQKEQQFLYEDGGMLVFMDMESYEQIQLSADVLGDRRAFLQEGMTITVEFYENEVLNARLPQKVVCQVAETEPVLKGQTAASSFKPALLENGVRVMVPPFVGVGERIWVNTETMDYAERA